MSFLVNFTHLLLFPTSRERVCQPKDKAAGQKNDIEKRSTDSIATTLHSPPRTHQSNGPENGDAQNGPYSTNCGARSLLKSSSMSGSKSVVVKGREAEVS